MRLLFTTCFYNRPKISKLYLLGLERLRKIHDFELLVCCSDDESVKLCEEESIDYFTHENLPLGEKHNILFSNCLQYDFDFLIHSGDDDIISDKGFKKLLELMETEEYIVNPNIYFLGSKALKFSGTVLGAFRVFSRRVVELGIDVEVVFTKDTYRYDSFTTYTFQKDIAEHYQRFGAILGEDRYNLWTSDINKSLDFHSHSRLIELGVKPYFTDFFEIVDVKSKQNITSIEKLWVVSEEVEHSEVTKLMGKKEIDYLKTL